ncbi:MAG: peptidoglycan-binding protein, partial [Clostridia bacterium]|nr:peptidoglycan-binding protein [Clostridia bacterium]
TLNDAKWIYDNIGEGTEVWIHEDGLIDPELKYANRLGEFSQKLGNHIATPEPAPKPDYDMAVTPAGGIRELKVGAEGDDVFWLQNRLKELGYYLGSVTGQYREGTRDAVKAYQRDNKLRVNGTANKETQELLYSQTAQAVAALQPTPAPTAIPAPATDYVVGEGK